MNPLELTNYKARTESEFEQLENHYNSRVNKFTDKESVLQFLLDHKEHIWWWSWELISKTNSKGAYLSHRACARASDLALHHPDLVEDRRIGRFKVYRLKVENMDLISQFLNEVH